MGGDLIVALLPFGAALGIVAAVASLLRRRVVPAWKRVLFAGCWFITGLIAPTVLLLLFGTLLKMSSPQPRIPQASSGQVISGASIAA
jgi:hypothetical protein